MELARKHADLRREKKNRARQLEQMRASSRIFQDCSPRLPYDVSLRFFFRAFSLPPTDEGEGPLTATKTSAPGRGRANRAVPGFGSAFGSGFCPASLKIHRNL